MNRAPSLRAVPAALIAALGLSFAAGPALAAPVKLFVICYPGGSVKARDAEPSTKQMLRALERMGGWAEGSFESRFTTDTRECQQLMSDRPPFAIVSLGDYLSNPGLVPLVQPEIDGKSTDTYRVLVRKGTASSLADLKGKTLGGTLLDQPEFLERIVFRGQARAADFKTAPTKQPLKSLRALSEGTVDAVIVNDQQFRAVGDLPFAADLAPVFTSEPVPLVGIVADGKKTTAEERKRLSGALAGFCKDEQGRGFCEAFGIDAFVPVEASAFEGMRGLWK